MKEQILQEIEDIKSTLKYPIYSLQKKLDPSGSFNYYWDVLEFINWVKIKYPKEYEDEELEEYYQHILDFGYFYVQVFKPKPTPIVHEDGILGIGIPIEEMITQLYDKVISLTEEAATDLKTVLDNINMWGNRILKANADTEEVSKESINSRIETKMDFLVQQVNPTSEYKTKKEQREAMAKAQIAKMLLKK